MDRLIAELHNAKSELDFWRDFVAWKTAESSFEVDPRVYEAMKQAETRYEEAKRVVTRSIHLGLRKPSVMPID